MLMGRSVDSALLGLSCPCTHCSETTLPPQRKRSRLLLKVIYFGRIYTLIMSAYFVLRKSMPLHWLQADFGRIQDICQSK